MRPAQKQNAKPQKNVRLIILVLMQADDEAFQSFYTIATIRPRMSHMPQRVGRI
jgi:hypothetical protein